MRFDQLIECNMRNIVRVFAFPGRRPQFVFDGPAPNLYLAALALKLYLPALAS